MTPMQLNARQLGDVVVLDVVGSLTMSGGAMMMRQAIRRWLDLGLRKFVVNLAECDYMDSAGINVLFHLRERLRVRGQEVRLVVPPGSGAYDALRYAGVLDAVALSDSVDAALAELPSQVEFPGA